VAEYDTERGESRQVERHRPNLLTLLAGVGTLLVASYVLTDGAIWVPTVDPRWLLAGGAVVVGLVLLANSLRGNRRNH
jgi:hypothetical protein